MIYFLTTQPLWVSGTLLIGVTTVLAMLGPALIRRFIPLEKLALNNEIAGFKFSTIGVLYAVLLAFVIIVVWQKFSDADANVAQEAAAVATVYRLSQGLGETPGGSLRTQLTAYVNAVITGDWPAMARGDIGARQAARRALDAVYTAVLAAKAQETRDVALEAELLHQLDVLTQTRRIRLSAAEGSVPPVIWLVLFTGAALTIGFTFFFGTENLRAQTIMTGLLSFVVFAELLIIVAIDRPFSGTVKVEPIALAEALKDFTK